MLRAEKHYFDVTLKFRRLDEANNFARLVMPVWTPGHYLIEEYARNVVRLTVKDGDGGQEVPLVKEAKNVWKAETGEARNLTVEYTVYALDYRDTSSYIDHLHAIINGPSLFIYPEGRESSPARVKLVPHPSWNRVTTPLKDVGGFNFEARDVHELMDSPFEVGNQQEYRFTVGAVEHIVSMFGTCPVDQEGIVRDIKKIVECEINLFGDVPYRRYAFIVNFTDEHSGGLEHMESTVCFVPRLRLVPKEEYNLTMGLFSHEFFHAWNVKRLRPRELLNYDYGKENYTRSLWVAEGITSYYDDLMLRRAGIFTVGEYLDAFCSNVNIMKSYPGARWQSAEEASFDAWIKYYRQDQNSPNVTMSYYVQGAVIGWMLDMEIRKNSKNRKNLDDVLRSLYYERYVKSRTGYTDEDFERKAEEIGGVGVKEIFETRVRGTRDVDFEKYLKYAGLTLIQKDEEKKKTSGFIGIRLTNDGSKCVVGTVLAGSPAESMGLATGDEIVGVDKLRLTGERLSFYISNRTPGTRIELLYARNGEIRLVRGKIGARPTFEYRIVPLPHASDDQRELFSGWLLEEWKSTIAYPEYRRSPDRRYLLDFV